MAKRHDLKDENPYQPGAPFVELPADVQQDLRLTLLVSITGIVAICFVLSPRSLFQFDESFLWCPGLFFASVRMLRSSRVRRVLTHAIVTGSVLYFATYSLINKVAFSSHGLDIQATVSHFFQGEFRSSLYRAYPLVRPLHFLFWVMMAIRLVGDRLQRTEE